MQAALVVLLVGSALLLGGLFFGRHPLRDSSLLWGARLSQSAVTSNGAVEELTRHELDGKQVIKGGRRLVVSQVRVNPGADITFQAGEVVAFGDGFQVVQGARMTVGSDRSSRGSKEDRGRSGHR